MTGMRGSSNFRLRERGGGRTESDRKMLCQLLGPQTYPQWVQRPQFVHSISKKTVLFGSKGGPTFSRDGVTLNYLFPIEHVIFKVSPGHLFPQPPLWVCA